MSKNDVDSKTLDLDAGKKTLLGVGLASLMRKSKPGSVPDGKVMPAPHEPSVQVSGELSFEEEAGPASEAGSEDRLLSKSTQLIEAADDPTDDDLALASRTPKRRWIAAVVVGCGTLGVSIGVGVGARRSLSSAHTSPHATVPISTDAAGAVSPAAAVAPRDSKPDVPALATHVDPPAATARPEPIAPPSLRTVVLGDGSCSAFLDSRSSGDVSVDDQAVGPTPVLVSGLWCGRPINVRIDRRGFDAWTKTVVPQEGRTSRVVATLHRSVVPAAPPAPPTARPAVDAAVTPTHTVDPFVPSTHTVDPFRSPTHTVNPFHSPADTVDPFGFLLPAMVELHGRRTSSTNTAANPSFEARAH